MDTDLPEATALPLAVELRLLLVASVRPVALPADMVRPVVVRRLAGSVRPVVRRPVVSVLPVVRRPVALVRPVVRRPVVTVRLRRIRTVARLRVPAVLVRLR